jgi:D-3-phosphoglycerate dehydrogenase / 2-oxoglutarate reductase
MKPKILAADKIHDRALEKAKTFADVDLKTGLSEDELIKIIPEYDAIIIRSKPKVTRAIIEAGNKLKAIGRAGVGLDNVDRQAAKEKGVEVVNSPEASTISVAEHAIALMLSAMRHIPHSEKSTKSGGWDRKKYIGNELYGKTLGIIGFGRIGREVALRARAFNMNLTVYDPAITSEDAREYNSESVELDELFRKSDIITLHVPAIESTRDLVNRERLALMKPTAVLVNTSRGHAIDEGALYDALKEGKIRCAALDVYKSEPPEGSPLLTLDNIITVPHLGANTDEAQVNAGVVVVEKIQHILQKQA